MLNHQGTNTGYSGQMTSPVVVAVTLQTRKPKLAHYGCYILEQANLHSSKLWKEREESHEDERIVQQRKLPVLFGDPESSEHRKCMVYFSLPFPRYSLHNATL